MFFHVFMYMQEGESTLVKFSFGLKMESILIVAALCQIILGMIIFLCITISLVTRSTSNFEFGCV